eukprot:NODE_1123_length_1063_cov_188.057199_g774_i0.p2 GENE.NODE_1123_length_1063_cov_188.057199_g774_i0~~NODE_1123_length_1063_cov_188.057199_g774_i0.p2  ORF type:complete len:137 (+),score=7.35 NODE_1123_length_1063_cov_188.057199_g774_i0:30-413(+)
MVALAPSLPSIFCVCMCEYFLIYITYTLCIFSYFTYSVFLSHVDALFPFHPPCVLFSPLVMCVCVFIHIYAYVFIPLFIHTFIFIHLYVCIYTFMSLFMHIFGCIYIYIYVHLYSHNLHIDIFFVNR